MEIHAKRRRHVEEHLSNELDLLKQYEDAMRVEDDPQKQAKLENQIRDVRNRIQAHKDELSIIEQQSHATEASLTGVIRADHLTRSLQVDQLQIGVNNPPALSTAAGLTSQQHTPTLTDDSFLISIPPPSPTNFVGRSEDISELFAAVTTAKMVVITGVLGIGKTTLLRRLTGEFDQSSVFWHDFNPGLVSLEDVLMRLARFFDRRLGHPYFSRAMSASDLSAQDKILLLVNELNRSGGYLFFDRVETVEGDAPLEGFFSIMKEQNEKGLIFLASRSRPSFVKPLDEAKNKVLVAALAGLSDDETVEYLEGKGIRISEEGAKLLNRVFDGLPLALELLAALAGAGDSESELLARADAVREQVIEQLFEELYARLSPPERELLTTAALFRLPFKKERLLGAHRVLFQRNAAADFGALRRHCLTSDGAEGYHQVHEVVSAMALSNAGADVKVLRCNLAEHLLNDAPDDYTAHLEALLLLKAAGDLEQAAEVAGELIDRRFVPYEPEMAERILRLFTADSVSRERWMWLLGDKGLVAHHLRRFDEAEGHYSEMLKLAGEIESKAGEALALQRLGVLHNDKQNGALSEEYYRRSLALKIELGDEEGQAQIYNNLGSIYSGRGEFEKAGEELKKGLELRRQMNLPEWLFLALYSNLGILYAEQERWDEAFEYSTKALHVAEEMQSPYDIAKSLYNLGKHEYERGDTEAAREKYLSVMEIAESYENDELEELASVALGRLYNDAEDFDQAISYFKRVAAIYEKFDQKAPLAAIYFDIGTFYLEKEDNPSALDWYLKGIELFEHFTDERRIEIYLQNIRVIANMLDDEEAIRKLVRAVKSLKNRLAAQGESLALARVYGTLGDIYLDVLERDRVAISCFRHEIKLLAELGLDRELVKAQIDLGGTFESVGRYADALEVTDEAMELAGSRSFDDWLCIVLYNRGNYYAELELYEQAESSYRRAEEYAPKIDDRDMLQIIHHNLGEVFRRQRRLDDAVELLSAVLSRAKSNDDYGGVVGTLNNLGLAYDEMGRDVEALRCWHEAVSFSRLHSLKRDEANTLISIGNFYLMSDQPAEAKGYYEQALSAARGDGDTDMEEGCILSLAHAHRKLGTFQGIEEEFKAAAERADKLRHYESLIKFLTLGGEVNLDEGESEASAEMFEQAFLFAFWRAVDVKQQFTHRDEDPRAGAEAGYVIRRILASVERSYEADKVAEAHKVVDSLVNRLKKKTYFGDGFPINFLGLMEEYMKTRPNISMSEYIADKFRSPPMTTDLDLDVD